jgi:hypothetical protein
MTKAQKTIAITFSTIIGLIILIGAVLLATSSIVYIDGKFYTEMTDYSPRVSNENGIVVGCMAFMPSCGYCVDNLRPGNETLVRDEQCYRAL